MFCNGRAFRVDGKRVYYWRYGCAMDGEPSVVVFSKEYPSTNLAEMAFLDALLTNTGESHYDHE
jgi:hypothetical protein